MKHLQPVQAEGHGPDPVATPVGEPEELVIQLLGGFSVSVGSRAVADAEWQRRKATSLLKLLALARGHRLHREQVIDLLWSGRPHETAANNLHRTLHTLRQIIAPRLRADGLTTYLRMQDQTLALCPSVPLRVDVDAFMAASDAARRTGEPAAYHVALELYRGDLLPDDRYEEWIIPRREQLRALYLDLLTELARLHEAQAEPAQAIAALQRVVATEPIHEGAHTELMRLYALSGQRYHALRQYAELRDALRRELEAEPDACGERMYQNILANRHPTAGSSLPLAPIASGQRARPTNAPRRLTRFVGRSKELREVRQLLSETRLLTLTGAGGCGKTRLALEVAGSLEDAYPDGVCFVDLSVVAPPHLVLQQVAAALGVRGEPGHPLLHTVARFLLPRELLLVLDNCEHLVSACARLAETLLQDSPGLRILATSRESLGMAGETAWLVPSLEAPDPERLPPLEHLQAYDAVRLFVERARSSRPGFEVTTENAAAVARICHATDGIPLAIELATVRLKAVSVDQIASRLDTLLRLLSAGSRTAIPRHRTLRATLDWSYNLLDEEERRLLARLAVFVGGWTLEAAEGVCACDGISQQHILDLIAGLVDKSLVSFDEQGTPGSAGGGRYRLLETIRQYGLEKLEESGEAKARRRLHAEYYLTLAEWAESLLAGPAQGRWLERLEAEHDNLRAALGWAHGHGTREPDAIELGLRLGAALWRFWEVRGYLHEGRRWLEGMLAIGDGAPAATRAKALHAAGNLTFDQDDYPRATALHEASLALKRELGDVEGVARSLTNLGNIACEQGDYGRATRRYEESLVLCRQLDDAWLTANVLHNLGRVARLQGEYARATGLLGEALTLRQQLGDREALAKSLDVAGEVALRQGKYERAIRLHETSLRLRRDLDETWGIAISLTNLATALSHRGDHPHAATLYQEALALHRDVGSKADIPACLEGLAAIAGARQERVQAARLWSAAETLRATLGASLPPADREDYNLQLAAIRAGTDPAVWEAAWAAGRMLPLDDVIEGALSMQASGAASTPELSPAVARIETLSRREQEIARLIARGMTNRQIAAELRIAGRTADTHVSRILKKLGLTSRAQVGACLPTSQG